jgi:hypothetical protein
MITLQYTVEELEHLWGVLTAHLKTHQAIMGKFQQQATAQTQQPPEAEKPAN